MGWTHYLRLGSEPIGLVRGGQLYFLHNDQLGRPEIATNSAKNAIWRASNYAFDRTVTQDSIGGINLGLPGQYYDAETGNWHNGFRDYWSGGGRYLQSDPISMAGGLNTYAYTAGNPISYVDPLGLEVLVGQHPAFVNNPQNPLNHAAIVLRPDNPAAFVNHPLFRATQGREATLGGQPFGSSAISPFGSLQSAPNYPGDNPNGLKDLTSVPCPGMSDTDFINALINAASAYGNNRPYDPFPVGPFYNSNSYVSGVIRAAGGVPPDLPGLQPGYGHPLPIGP